MLKYILFVFLCAAAGALFLSYSATGQRVVRSEFLSYEIRAAAEEGEPDGPLKNNAFYVPLRLDAELRCEVEIPILWLDREIFIQVTGASGADLMVNGVRAGQLDDEHTPTQFNISAMMKDSTNYIEFIPNSSFSGRKIEAFIFSQPKVRIDDFSVALEPDSAAHHGILRLDIILANSYNTDETATVGFDIYSPQGKLLHFNFKEITLGAQSIDTLRFTDDIWHTADNYWSAEKPLLHRGMLSVRRGNRYTEYIPFTVGFGISTHFDGRLLRNEKPIEIRAENYNAPPDRTKAEKELTTMKKNGINSLHPDHPQPAWFYNLCDRMGFYVIEQPSVYPLDNEDDPMLLEEILRRTATSYHRVKNHPCIIGFSLSKSPENNYNLQRNYLLLKQLELRRAIIFNSAKGSWNSDINPLQYIKK